MNSEKLKKTFKKVFPKVKIPKKMESLTYGSIKSWDSLKHFNLLLQIEEDFNIKFSPREMSRLKHAREILEVLKKK